MTSGNTEQEFLRYLQQAQRGDSSAQAKIDEFQKKNARGYLQVLAKILADDSLPTDARAVAGLSWKNLFDIKEDNKLRDQRAKQWLSLPPDFRKGLKTCALRGLTSKETGVYRAAAQVIAEIAHIELPAQQWPELLKLLLSQVKATDKPPESKIPILNCLEYICEGIPSIDATSLNDILNALTQGMKRQVGEPLVILAAAVAFEKCLELIDEQMSKEAGRTYIMKIVCDACGIEHNKVREQALRVLGKMAGLYYRHFGKYMKHIFTITTNMILKAAPVVAMQALEFWCIICETEIAILDDPEANEDFGECQKFIERFQNELVPFVLQAMVRTEFPQYTEEWDLPASASVTLGLIANTVRDPVVDKVWEWIKNHIKDSSPYMREAAAMAFGAILDGPSTQTLAPVINRILPVLVQLLTTDSTPQVRQTAVWALARVCEFHCTLVCDSKMKLEKILAGICKGLKDIPDVAVICCLALHNVAVANPDAQRETSCLSSFFKNVINSLLIATERDDVDGTDLVNSAFDAITVFIANSALESVELIKTLCERFIMRLRQTFSIATHNAADVELRIQQQGYLCAVLLVIVQKLDTLVKPYARRMIDLYVQIFKSSGGSAYVHEDALMAVGSVASALEQDFDPYVDEVMPFVIKGLGAVQQHAVCTASVGALSDIARAIGPEFSRLNCDQIMKLLVSAVQNPALHRSVKPHILAAFGDIALSLGDKYVRYLPTVMKMLLWASKTAKRDNDEDFCFYVDALREGILDGLTGVLQSLKEHSGRTDLFKPYLSDLISFIETIWADPDISSSATLAVTGIIGELARTCGGPAASLLRSRPPIANIIKQNQRSADEELAETANWSLDQLNSALRSR